MSDILENLAAAEAFLEEYAARVATVLALQEDAAMMKGSVARAAVLAKVDAVQTLQDDAAIFIEAIPMPQREELLAEAMTHARHVWIEDLSKAQQDVAMLRLEIGHRWTTPDVMDSYVFLVSEVGEVGDVLLRANHGHRSDYSRNNTKYADVGAELGDAYLMLCTLATALGIDLDSALQKRIDKLKEKHGHVELSNGS